MTEENEEDIRKAIKTRRSIQSSLHSAVLYSNNNEEDKFRLTGNGHRNSNSFCAALVAYITLVRFVDSRNMYEIYGFDPIFEKYI